MSNYPFSQPPNAPASGQQVARISPVTNRPMFKAQVAGSGKVVVIDVDEMGGVFLDPTELAELAEIEGVQYLLQAEINRVAMNYSQSQGYPRTQAARGYP